MKLSVAFKKLHDYLTDKDYRIIFNAHRGFYNKMGDKEYLELMYRALMHKELNLDNPQTFNEKLQWLKLYDRRPEYTTMVDKYAVKQYVANIIGEQYIIPTLGVWNHFDEIDFDKLPNQFVLKCTHDSGGLVICKDKNKFDKVAAKKKIETCLKQNYFYLCREWPYKNVKPRIIAEKYMEDSSTAELRDYKIYTFNGKAKLCMINKDRGIHTTADYFDNGFTWQGFRWGHDNAKILPKKPQNYELMFNLAEKLAKGTLELRVDFYEVDRKIYFGELTFFDGSGFEKFEPNEWDYKLGSWMELPPK